MIRAQGFREHLAALYPQLIRFRSIPLTAEMSMFVTCEFVLRASNIAMHSVLPIPFDRTST
jgi:hypothetical protein